MKLNEILNQLNLGNLSILIFLVLSLVEISPIKINPWSMLLRWIARLLGISDLKTEIVQLRDRMDELEKKIDNMKISEEEKEQLKEALAARRRILRFNMKLTNDIKFVWDYFKGKGLTDYGIAGLMGNLYAESGLRSNTLERLCIKRYAELGINFTDELYTRSVDNGAISKDEFLHPMGKHCGYGLAQWTTDGRKAGLYDHIKSKNASISDLKYQCEYLYSELEKAFKSTLNVLKTASDVNTASDYVLLHFEQPRDAESQIDLRRKYSNEIYNLLGGGMVIIGSARIDENSHASGGIRRMLVKLG